MKSSAINANSSSQIHNDYQILDNHIRLLEKYRSEISKTFNAMEKSITELNDKGFQDGNFENLHKVFMSNVNNVKQFEKVVLKFENHCSDLSKLIKTYYSVEI
jgi:hypothetical protein